MPRAVAPLVCLLAGLALAGCGNGDDEREASQAVTRLIQAVDGGDGRAACAELSEEAQYRLADQEGKPCETAVLGLELSSSPVADASVSISSAQVVLDDGDAFFLDDTTGGWKVSAAGCEPSPGRPYDCQLEV